MHLISLRGRAIHFPFGALTEMKWSKEAKRGGGEGGEGAKYCIRFSQRERERNDKKGRGERGTRERQEKKRKEKTTEDEISAPLA